ncbi:hypothetical protein EWM64_g7331 [Hericium alpestre]|uniref:DNA 3'-5' helicase n=1 Tax=Hericium alpestre TaxID=135208 RepID=A0A4Y9ZT71_9AGAM|nr:hypothetical protein EWM64_g7331 [Hericium alpestre]
MITVVVEPTNALENNMTSNLKNKGLTAIVINAEEIEEAKTKSCNLWDEAKSGQYQVITLSPEMLKSQEYSVLNNDPYFWQHWHVLVVDEAHLVDHWGTDFRKAYADIWALRSRGPEHLTLVAMSASVERGEQMTRILQCLGYHENAFHLDKRDCQHHNVDLIFCTVQFTSTGFEFHDLDWLVPEDLASASDVPKCIVYSDTIETGHCITVYLRGLLPSHLQSSGTNLVCHMHSMNCPKCKKEGLAALNATNSERTTAIFVATAVWEVGLDVPDISSVIMFPAPASASSIIQRAGRPARSPGMHGQAIVYVKKTEIEASLEYVQCDPVDSRLLDPKNLSVLPSAPTGSQTDSRVGQRSASEVNGGIPRGERRLGDASNTTQETVVSAVQGTQGNIQVESENIEMGVEMESEIPDAPDAANTVPMPEARVISSAVQTSNSAGLDSGTGGESSTRPVEATKQKTVRGKSKAKGLGASKKVGNKKAVDLPHPEQGKQPCVACHLIIAAHACGLCISCQINIIYDNPGADHDCGHCSSCLPRLLPTPRPMPSPIPTSPESMAPPSENAPNAATLLSYMKLMRAEVEELLQELNHVSRRVWRKIIHGPESFLIGPSSFLRPDIVKHLTTDFHLLSSVQDLERHIRHNWRY